MSECTADNLTFYLSNFSGQDPIRAVQCPFTQEAGAGMPVEVFGLFLFGMFGIALSIRSKHPGPILVVGLLTAGAFVTVALPGLAARVLAIVVFATIVGAGLYLYQRSKNAL